LTELIKISMMVTRPAGGVKLRTSASEESELGSGHKCIKGMKQLLNCYINFISLLDISSKLRL